MDKIFYHYLYSRDRVSKMVYDYSSETLLKSTNPIERMSARKVSEYYNLMTDERFLIGKQSDGDMLTLLKSIKKLIDQKFKGLDYKMNVRVKDLFSTLNKIELVKDETYQASQELFLSQYSESNVGNGEGNTFENWLKSYSFQKNPFDRIRDFMAFRIILEDDGDEESVCVLYDIANSIIEFVNKRTVFDVIPAAPPKNTGLKNKSSLIIIPEKTVTRLRLKAENIPFVKDYVLTPKEDGYQSLHIVMYDPFTRQYVELQICTRSMRLIAESDANHAKHKEKTYGNKQKELEEKIKFGNIHLANKHFRYYKTSSKKEGYIIHDEAGITKPFIFDLYTIDELRKFIETW